MTLEKKAPPTRGQVEPQITAEAAAQAVRAMSDLQFFPAATEGRAMLVDDLRSMCHDTQELRWIVSRMRSLFSQWPGSRTMRIVFCQKHHPLDGADLSSGICEAYPDGFPLESPVEETAPLALPAGHSVSASPSIENAVCDLAVAKDLNLTGRRHVRDVPLINVPEEQRITKADIESAVQQLHEQQAREQVLPTEGKEGTSA
jgi:hypothetical protein